MPESLSLTAEPLLPEGPPVNLGALAGDEQEPQVDEKDREDPPEEDDGAQQEPSVDPPDKDMDDVSGVSH